MDVLGARVNFCCHSDVAIKGEIKKKKKNPAYVPVLNSIRNFWVIVKTFLEIRIHSEKGRLYFQHYLMSCYVRLPLIR